MPSIVITSIPTTITVHKLLKIDVSYENITKNVFENKNNIQKIDNPLIIVL